jgi:hypothetical protein
LSLEISSIRRIWTPELAEGQDGDFSLVWIRPGLANILGYGRRSESSAMHRQEISSTALTSEAQSATLSGWDSKTEISDEASYALSLFRHRYLHRRGIAGHRN